MNDLELDIGCERATIVKSREHFRESRTDSEVIEEETRKIWGNSESRSKTTDRRRRPMNAGMVVAEGVGWACA
jgi:hypothetical protein